MISGLGDPEAEEVEWAVEHICFLTDINMIYETALGMYNLELALAVAQQSQKDPREYLPYLQSIQELSDGERKFRIDDDLKRYPKALTHLQKFADTERITRYTEKHELYRDALDLNKYNKGKHDEIMRAYANFLNTRNRFCEAAIGELWFLRLESLQRSWLTLCSLRIAGRLSQRQHCLFVCSDVERVTLVCLPSTTPR